MCMNVTSKPNADSKSKAAATFAATWQYPMGPVDQPVHAFPNAKLNTTDIPIRLSNLSALNFDVAWNYGAGNDKPTSTNTSGLVDAEMNANVCIDMFLAADKAVSDDTTKSDYEVMVWFGAFGAATQPIGLPAGAVDHHTVNGTTFDLYAGANAFGQKVFTWVADQNTTRFVGEISGLVNKLQANGGPQTTAWLGYIAFGSEAYSAAKNVTFSVTELAVDIQAVSA
ncbi:concanavalin A-like lectin/glucanase [Trichodelitschia bisporula]|uniref:Concanavalin A-like lectin/glucanase n=1 Tax=Trichodelitschia bisporula TaxID=703511 RepID=A0A6G1IA77_9PEZI|nr:concanavalin A-like lectin/glucanase [Trichodelitschia bisporula]